MNEINFKNDLEKFNLLWSKKANHIFTQEEYDRELKENPNLKHEYYSQEKIAKKYAK